MIDDLDIEGLEYLKWSMFDSPDKKGSGYMYMERLPVSILDDIISETRLRFFDIELGYVSESYANKHNMALLDSHRIGKAIKLRILNPKKRFDLVSHLVLRGVSRISVSSKSVYFDTDDLKERGLFVW